MMTAAPAICTWRPEYSVGMPFIDNQHQTLIRLINDLHLAMREGQGKEALAGVIGELVHYTESHFAAEEAMMQKRRYSGLASHIEEHKRLRQQVLDMRDKVQAGSLTVTIGVLHFLKSWLTDHILVFDRNYARELNGR